MISKEAQDKIIAALVTAAFNSEDLNEIELAEEIRWEASRLAKRWGIYNVPGLPKTWKTTKRIADYE